MQLGGQTELAAHAAQIFLAQQIEVRFLAQVVEFELPQNPAVPGFRQPVKQRQFGVKLQRVEAVGRGQKNIIPAYPDGLGDELLLPRCVAHMLQHCGGKHQIETRVGKGQPAAVAAHETHAGEEGFEAAGILIAERGDPFRMGVTAFKKVGVGGFGIRGHADVEHRLQRFEIDFTRQCRINFPPHRKRGSGRQRFRRDDAGDGWIDLHGYFPESVSHTIAPGRRKCKSVAHGRNPESALIS
ncbi:hypothetical protein SDC9_127095 [bioreactor metagenome]|uniref:Uncharacterized protein n=1 Tax=bioreactor metagenome TaxID=1076179 RepID=A0A645CSD8_9ZZZZ